MRQDSRHAVHRSHRPAVQKLAVDALGEAALLEDHDDRVFRIRQRRNVDIRNALTISWGGQIDVAFADRGTALAGLRDELQQGTAEGHEVAQILAHQQSRAGVEKLFCCWVYEENVQVGPDHHQRHRQGAGDRCRRRRFFELCVIARHLPCLLNRHCSSLVTN